MGHYDEFQELCEQVTGDLPETSAPKALKDEPIVEVEVRPEIKVGDIVRMRSETVKDGINAKVVAVTEDYLVVVSVARSKPVVITHEDLIGDVSESDLFSYDVTRTAWSLDISHTMLVNALKTNNLKIVRG